MTTINEEKKYWELKKRIKIINSQRRDVEKVILIEDGKKIGIKLLSVMILLLTG